MGAPAEALDGRAFVADTSCWHRRAHADARDVWRSAMSAGQIAITPVVRLELLYAVRRAQDFAAWESDLAHLPEAPLDRSTAQIAQAAMRDLAATGEHRVPPTDALIAAAAAQRGLGVLHHDAHFDPLCLTLGIESRWLPPRPRR